MDETPKPQTRKKGLGRGLDALLGAARTPVALNIASADVTPTPPPASTNPDAAAQQSGERVHHLPLEQIQRGRYQPRRDFDPESLRELADSILAQGVIQPVLVRALGVNRFELIAGERRWRACQMAGLAEIPALVREVDESSALAIGLIENIQRADLNPLEEASALARLVSEFELTHQQVAEAVGRSRTAVTNLLRLLELEDEVKLALAERQLDMGHARALLGLKGALQCRAARQVIQAGLSVRQTERLVRHLQKESAPEGATRAAALDPNIRRLQDDLTDRLGAAVRIQHGQRGAGKLVISYSSLDELDGILGHFQ
ncbi:MAG: ParB/RepB/Spo0J family partition protein [Chromatiaceae bacterium]|nr:ParB/RepB/Spo0J family partition protein [Chromatiaceae bacterium]